ncbi:MAG: NAD(P)H-hydrate dehydratase [Firmicutes bacterium]|nr:NAD(P)H-hydrate dehydratase [Bacillota bacterium]
MQATPSRLVTAAQMRALDRRAQEYGLPGIVLMENAARVFVRVLLDRVGDLGRKRVAVFCGKGNNGGDGLAIARYLLLAGARVQVFLLARVDDVQGDARANLEIWRRWGQSMEEITTSEPAPAAGDQLQGDHLVTTLKDRLEGVDVIIDAIFGTGFRGVARPPAGWVIPVINELSGAVWPKPGNAVGRGEVLKTADDGRRFSQGPRIFAVDVPSGLDADTGQVAGPCVRAEATVTFGLAKPGLLVYPGAGYVGSLYVGNISLPPGGLPGKAMVSAASSSESLPVEKPSSPPPEEHNFAHGITTALNKRDPLVEGSQGQDDWYEAITVDAVRPLRPARPFDSHKGTFGHLLVVAGSRGLTGAAALASEAALRVGAGLVTLGLPASLQEMMASKLTEVMTLDLPDAGDGSLSREAGGKVLEALSKRDGLVLGPGISTRPGTAESVNTILSAQGQGGDNLSPLVLDADALNLLAGVGGLARLREWPGPVVLTPHPGELARLLGIARDVIQENRLRWAKEAAIQSGAVVVLKGARTLVALPTGEIYINLTGNPGLATAGTGDVLAGVIGGLLVQGLAAAAAARLGVFLHGLAGDLAAARFGQPGLLAGDVRAALPEAILALEQGVGPRIEYIFV